MQSFKLLSSLLFCLLITAFYYALLSLNGMSPSPNESAKFETMTINALVITTRTRTIPITIHQITESNKHLVPSFEKTNIEFFTLSQSMWFQRNRFSVAKYQQMLQRVTASSKQHDAVTANNKEPILRAIVREFGDRHSIKLHVASTRLFKVTAGLGVHLDPVNSPACPEIYCFKLWIPLTATEIDNLCLGVGDVSRLNANHQNCAVPSIREDKWCSDFDFNQVTWYQQTRMTNQDWVFFQGDRVPHYAANLGNTRNTQQRWALVVHMKFADLI